MTTDPSPWPGRGVVLTRGLVFGLVLAFLCSGMVLRQALDLKEIDGIALHSAPQWIMFSNVGLGAIQVRYVQVHPDGTRTRLDRFEVLGASVLDQPRGVWRVHGREGAKKLGRKLCRRLGLDADVRVFARTARRTGWVRLPTHNVDLCDPERR